MKEIRYPSLGETWLAAVEEIYRHGVAVGDEGRELRNLAVGFAAADASADPLLTRFGSTSQIDHMRRVFFSSEPNGSGHSYADKLRGPQGRRDLSDVVELLTREPSSKRAVVTLVGAGDGQVPCINTVHFLRREGGLTAAYFARGQDMFRKFYADAICLHEMARRVGAGLGLPVVDVFGLISSAHIYLADLGEIGAVLDQAGRRQAV
jgi:hypothetical protein